MNTKLTKFLLPLAALSLVTVACDPFPAKPGGDPVMLRITSHGPNGDSNTVETVTNGGTVVTDLAWVNDVFHVHFNKPMDGSSIQGNSQYNADGSTATDGAGNPVPCEPAAGLTLSANFPTGTEVCYDPNSPTEGGQMLVRPAGLLLYGQVYNIAGTVRDYEGKALAIDITITVDQRPLLTGWDGYTIYVDWFDSGADSYELLQGATATGTFTSLGAGLLPVDYCDAGRVICEVAVTELVPNTEYFYQVKETTGATTTTRPAVIGAGSTLSPLRPSFGVATTPTPPITVIPGVIRVAWGAIVGANGYDLETSTDGATWTLAAHQVDRAFYAGAPPPGLVAPTSGTGTLTPGTTYWFRVTPTFASGVGATKGTPASSVSP